jgi:hypothetical protein
MIPSRLKCRQEAALRTTVAPLLLVTVFLAAAADAQTPRSAPTPGPVTKLPASMALDASFLARLPPPAFAQPFVEVEKAVAALKESIEPLKSAREAALLDAESCKKKNFTQEDMTAAGCNATDTLFLCSVKLFGYCTDATHSVYQLKRNAFQEAGKVFDAAALKIIHLPYPYPTPLPK